jgi:superfamily I DNA/RNA helicase|tara:strand:+ start:836 stop:2281 length:1446 start_codon:yes stop_codon:yes gene_type:complete
MRYKVIGPPGTGKTKTLLDEVDKYIAKGVPLNRIGYFAFTRNAANEARDRFLKKNKDLTEKDTLYFKTLHSLAFHNLGLNQDNVMNELHYKAIGETCGIQINYASYESNSWNGIFSSNSEYLNLINLARVRRIDTLNQFDLNEHLSKVERNKLDAIDKEINSYKKTYGLIDFTDMLDKFLKNGTVKGKLDVIFVDEAQDLSKIQWDMLEKIEKENEADVWIAGDDDQAIFGWAGADVMSFIKWKATEVPLQQSKRVPSEIQKAALSIVGRIEEYRLDKKYYPKKEKGQITEVIKIADIDMSKGSWLILARTNSLLKEIPKMLKQKGLFFKTSDGKNSIGKNLYEDIEYWNKMKKNEKIPEIIEQRILERIKDKKPNLELEWHEAFNNEASDKIDYLRVLLANKERIDGTPRITISTIHSAKGGEATNVVLFLNETTNTIKAASKSRAKRDEEYRVWYVAVTRSMQNLFLIKNNNKRKEFII